MTPTTGFEPKVEDAEGLPTKVAGTGGRELDAMEEEDEEGRGIGRETRVDPKEEEDPTGLGGGRWIAGEEGIRMGELGLEALDPRRSEYPWISLTTASKSPGCLFTEDRIYSLLTLLN